MRVKLLVGITVPLVFSSTPATAFGVLSLIGGIAAAVGAAGSTALSSVGVGPAGQSGASSADKVRKCRFSRGQHAGCWA
jgi:hypothetical protein